MSSIKQIIVQTFDTIHDFVREVEKAGLIDKGTISYIANDITNPADTNTYIKGIENLVSNLQVLIVNLKNVSSGIKPSTAIKPSSEIKPCLSSIQQSETISDDDNCDDPEEIQEERDNQGYIFTPSSTVTSQNLNFTETQPLYSYSSQLAPVVNSSQYSINSSTSLNLNQSLSTSLPPLLAQGDLKLDITNNPMAVVAVDMGRLSTNTGLLDLEETSSLLTISMDDSHLATNLTQSAVVQEKCLKCGSSYHETRLVDKGSKIIQLSSCSDCSSIAESVSKRRRKPEIVVTKDNIKNIDEVKTNENRKHTCEKCGRVFTKWRYFSIHHTKVHGDDDGMELNESNVEDDGGLPLYCCKTCNLACQTIQRFNVHTCRLPNDEDTINNLSNRILITNVLKLHKMRKFVCENCNLEYRTLKRISYHLPRCSPGPYRCNVCNLLAPTKKELNYHKKKSHRDEKCFNCEECGKSFQRRTSLQKHSVNWHESNNAVGPFKCELCPKKFIRRIYLTNHKIRMHGLDKKFLCQVCGNKFMNQNSLNAHMEVHNDVKKFQCSFCSKKFKRKEKLKYHERIHTGERPFLCQECGRGFVSKSKLDEHMSRHRGDRRYRCPHCTKTYAGAWDLKQHIRKIHDKLCDKVSATVVTSMNNPSASVLTQIDIVDPLAIATAASGLKEEDGGGTTVTILHKNTSQEVVHSMLNSGQYITVGSSNNVSIPVVVAAASTTNGRGMPSHLDTHIGQQVLTVSGNSSALLAASDSVETTPMSGTTTAASAGVQHLQTVQNIPGLQPTQEYSVAAIPSTNVPQGYIFAQGFDMLSPSIQY